MATKQVKKHKPIKHPYSKAKLRVLDSLMPPVTDAANWPAYFNCSACSKPIHTILVVESEVKNGLPYYVLECGECKKASWLVQLT